MSISRTSKLVMRVRFASPETPDQSRDRWTSCAWIWPCRGLPCHTAKVQTPRPSGSPRLAGKDGGNEVGIGMATVVKITDHGIDVKWHAAVRDGQAAVAVFEE
jgi:hypothetical protein